MKLLAIAWIAAMSIVAGEVSAATVPKTSSVILTTSHNSPLTINIPAGKVFQILTALKTGSGSLYFSPSILGSGGAIFQVASPDDNGFLDFSKFTMAGPSTLVISIQNATDGVVVFLTYRIAADK